MNILLKALMQMEENQLIDDVIIPLVEKLHPGRIEFTHSSIEAGRDIVSFGKDSLKRQHILCVQAKADKVTYGAQFYGIVVNPSQNAKTEGVTLENGEKCIPGEVWFITSSPFPEQERRQLSDTLSKLYRENIKFIAGDELCRTLIDNLPDITKKLCRYANKNIVELISILSKHAEGVAFEMDFERNINDFYITASFSPSFNNYLLSPDFENYILNYKKDYELAINDNLLDDDELCIDNVEQLIIEREKNKIKNIKLHQLFNIDYNIKILSAYEKVENGYPKKLDINKICKDYGTIKKLSNVYLTFRKEIFLNKFFINLSKQTKLQISRCPKKLTKNPNSIIKTHELLKKIEIFINLSSKEYYKLNTSKIKNFQFEPIELRILIKNPEYVLELGKNVLVEGQPGCGKTTFLRKIAVSLLEKNRSVKYINCYSIKNSNSNDSFINLVDKLSIGKFRDDFKNDESVLILDGLDESSFDISNDIISNCEKFAHVIASTRTAYDTNIRNSFFNIKLDPFSSEERDTFFDKIFNNDPVKKDICKNLFCSYPDIDHHTRIPLIASITSTLIKNGYTPTTRSEIYNFRLELLISKWDRVRGVFRIKIDNPKAKIRFLMYLAFKLHSNGTRNRLIKTSDLHNAYENSLGSWGYEFDVNDFINDIVVGSGVLLKNDEDCYSFGHLSFQEHLAGEYLSENKSLNYIIELLGDDWWKEPLIFWASKKGSITDLLDKLLNNEKFHFYSEQLLELARHAPYTSAGIVEILKEGSFVEEI